MTLLPLSQEGCLRTDLAFRLTRVARCRSRMLMLMSQQLPRLASLILGPPVSCICQPVFVIVFAAGPVCKICEFTRPKK